MLYSRTSATRSQSAAAQYDSVRNYGQVAEARPARLVQIMFERTLAHLATAQGCMERIKGNLPLNDVVAKGKAIGKAVRLIGHLDATLDMKRGAKIAENLHNLYHYMLVRLTQANADNNAQLVIEVSNLVRTIKAGWDGIVKDGR
jgi:flagellar secretion chaperone FliS